MLTTILNALIAIPQIATLVMNLVSSIVAWYMSHQTSDTLAAIADAAAFAAQANTDAQRYQAAAQWQKALSNTRYID
jgi:hypothetical protein